MRKKKAKKNPRRPTQPVFTKELVAWAGGRPRGWFRPGQTVCEERKKKENFESTSKVGPSTFDKTNSPRAVEKHPANQKVFTQCVGPESAPL